MDKLIVIKIGGNIIDNETKLSSFLKSFASVPEKKILVHGGGKVATKIGGQLNIESKYVNGRRITDVETLDLVTMVYAGLINKKIVAALQSSGCNAIGITGADGNLIPAKKRPVKEIDYGFAGDIDQNDLDSGKWQQLLKNSFIPVVAPLTHDGKGVLLNTNADTIAQELAKLMSNVYEVSLIYSFEKPGVMSDVNDESTVLPVINFPLYERLRSEEMIFAGMIPKLDNAFAALNKGVKKVIIGNAEELDGLIQGISGTTITNE